MIEHLLNSWSAMRALMQQGLLSGEDNEEEEIEAIGVFHDACFGVADAGHLDQAMEMGLRVFDADLAGDFYRDIMEVVSTHGHPIEGDDWEGVAKTKMFAIPVMGPLENLSRLYQDDRISKVFRSAGFADERAHVMLLGTAALGDAARLSPQSVWNITKAGTYAFAKLERNEGAASDFHQLRNLAPLIDMDSMDEDDNSVHSGILIGLRFDIEMDSDPIETDPLDESEYRREMWKSGLDTLLGSTHDCVLMSPMPWREGIVHMLLTTSYSEVFKEAGHPEPSPVSSVVVSSSGEYTDMSWFGPNQQFLAATRLPSDISFWALDEMLHIISSEGADVEVLPPSSINLATMPSPSRLLN